MVTSVWKYFIRPSLIFGKCFLIACITISVFISSLTCYDCVIGDGEIPQFSPIEKPQYELAISQLVRVNIPVNKTEQDRWEQLEETLPILDDINPVVANWVRNHHKKGTLIFTLSDGRGLDSASIEYKGLMGIAKYDYISDKLYINTMFFVEKHGYRAAVLCHEYRHSRQNVGKYFRYILSHVFSKGGDSNIIENDAYIYENDAVKIIYGEKGSPNNASFDPAH